jgi:hypothetical protein
MLLEKIKKFWKAGLVETIKDTFMPFGSKKEKKKILTLFVMAGTAILVMTGCCNELQEVPENREIVVDNEVRLPNEDDFDDAVSIAAIYRDIYDEAVETPSGHPSMPSGNKEETNTLSSLETLRRIVAKLGENGYVAVDSENQVDMAGAEQVIEFCKAVDEKKSAMLTIIVIKDFGFRKFDLKTEDGNVSIVRGYYQYDQDGCLQNRSTVSYPADIWQYTEEGYLLFEGSYFSDENYVLTLSDTPEHTALRVLPLDEKCRELNRKYILPVGYEQNNIFLTDWNEEDIGELDFYDIFDNFYPILYGQSVPYVADESLAVGAVYQIPEEIFENVIMTYFNVNEEALRRETTYIPEKAAYEYRPRGFYEVEYPDIPYPEVVSYTENQDGTITLIVNAVYPNGNTSMAYSHKTVIRPLEEDCFQYVSNQMISSSLSDDMEGYPEGANLIDEHDIWWHSNRLTKEEWIEIYGGTE